MRKIVITGTTGLLGSTVVASAIREGCYEIHAFSTSPKVDNPFAQLAGSPVKIYPNLNLDDYSVISPLIKNISPEYILHCAAISSPVACEQQPSEAWKANAESSICLARAASTHGVHLIGVSTDLVFEGVDPNDAPLSEDVIPVPLSAYSKAKRAGECAILELQESSAVARVSLLLGRSLSASKGHLGWIENQLEGSQEIKLFEDEYRTPIWTEDAAKFLLEMATRRLSGLYHLGTMQRYSRAEIGVLIAKHLGYDHNHIKKVSRLEVPSAVPRPKDVSLLSEKFFSATGLRATPLAAVFQPQ